MAVHTGDHTADVGGNAGSWVPAGCYGKESSTFKVPAAAVSELVRSLKLTEPRMAPAVAQMLIAVSLLALNIYLLAALPRFLTPLAWVLAGVTLSNLFVIAHDCAHNTFTRSRLLNRVIGELAMLPLCQPFAAYKQRHRKRYPDIRADAAARCDSEAPNSGVETDESEAESPTKSTDDYDPGLAEIPPKMHYAVQWFRDTYKPKVTKKTRRSVAQSQALIFTFLAFLVPTLYYVGGARALLKYWLLPLFAYKITYRPYFSVVTNNLNAYLPGEISTHVASYNLLKLCTAIQQQYKEVNTNLKEVVTHYAKRVNWLNVAILFGTPAISAYGIMTTPLQWRTALFAFIFFFWTGLGITAGYHRLWAHRAYDASFPVKLFLLLGGSGALEGSLKWWAGGHRVHHRYTDTLKDPYNSKGGFWYAHIGWMLVHPEPQNRAYADISDLNADPLIRMQHKYYLLFGPTMAFLFPALCCWLGWNDFWGGLMYAGYLRLVFLHHSTFCVNSVAHYLGEQTFDDERTPRDSIITAFLTFGEGYHNFHHEFPNDYRNGLKWYDYDPTKWLIGGLSSLGLTYNLREFDDNAIRMGVVHMAEKKTNQLKQRLTLPPDVHSLPTWSYVDFRKKCKDGERLTIIDGLIHDVHDFIDEHPGGKGYILSAIATDGSEKFKGNTGVYRHSNAARNVLAQFRVARLADEKVQLPPVEESARAEQQSVGEVHEQPTVQEIRADEQSKKDI